MTFETEYQLQQFNEIKEQYFDENDKLWAGLNCAPLESIMEQMLRLINQMETEIKELERENNDLYKNRP